MREDRMLGLVIFYGFEPDGIHIGEPEDSQIWHIGTLNPVK